MVRFPSPFARAASIAVRFGEAQTVQTRGMVRLYRADERVAVFPSPRMFPRCFPTVSDDGWRRKHDVTALFPLFL